jgi:hypothetical protein
VSGKFQARAAHIDDSVPSVARMYDYLLGGKDHYAVDRALVDAVGQVLPKPEQLARLNRRFMGRAARWLSRTAGVTQFLDCGSGLPTRENVHQVVRRHQPEAHVVYVDKDPIVAAHGRALLAEDDLTHFVAADFTDPDLLSDPTVATVLDWDEPIALLQCATLHHVPEEQDPQGVMRRLVEALPRGSFVVVSHVCRPDGQHYGQVVDSIVERASGAGVEVYFRSREQIATMFAGAALLDPGLVRLVDWWPEGPEEPVEPWGQLLVGGVGHKA